MPSNRRRSVAALAVAGLLVSLAAPTVHAAGRQETRGWWALVWSWFGPSAVLGSTSFVDPDGSITGSPVNPATLAYSGAVDPNGRAVAPAPPPVPASAVGDVDSQ